MTNRKYRDKRSKKVLEFLQAVDLVCKQHGFSISHEDTQGGFEVVPLNAETQEWFCDACDLTGAA